LELQVGGWCVGLGLIRGCFVISSSLFPAFDAARFCSNTQPNVELELLTLEHVPDLIRVVSEGDIWRNLHTYIPKPIAVKGFVDAALRDVAMGGTRAFVIRWYTDGGSLIVGTTRFFFLNLQHKRVQIGGTWLASTARGTGVNRVVKQIMLREAFEVMKLRRVEFAIHPDNQVSRCAVERIGGVLEGVLRQHVMVDGAARDSAMYSVLTEDWLAKEVVS
jgi:N-acetyltransferase